MLVSEWHDIVGPESAVTGIVLDKDHTTAPANLTVFLGEGSIIRVYEDQVARLNCQTPYLVLWLKGKKEAEEPSLIRQDSGAKDLSIEKKTGLQS